jgi:hypothetical protein
LDVNAELSCICNEITDRINVGINRIFESDMKVSEHMLQDNKDFMCNKIDGMINVLQGFKIKISNIKNIGDNCNE